MKKFQLVLGLLIIFSAYTFAQKVSGVVYFVDEPVKSAKVINANGDQVKTDVNGYFEINAAPDAVLNIVYKGVKRAAQLDGVDLYTDIVLVPSEKKFKKLIDNSPSVKRCELYLANYPDSKNSEEVKATLEKELFIVAYDNAVNDFNLRGLKSYLETYPEGQFAAKAEKTVDIVSWQKAKSQDTMEAYNAYLEQFPNGEAVSLAKSRMAMLGE
ncbi:hypothetical protein ACE01N_16670 [Saccharicrinis sp. FJH2]|uniref:hypothetical protein n=1 Tax=Saccharicrinis sp. FJH65 TaxID=3344659 RepID=UPI0035F25F7A